MKDHQRGLESLFVFPSPRAPQSNTLWQTRLADGFEESWRAVLRYLQPAPRNSGTRLSWVAPDAVVQRAMRHSSPETERHYQLGIG